MEKSAALTFYRREKFIHHYEKGGMTDVRFCGTAFCIIDFMGAAEAPDREEKGGTQEEQKVTHSKWSWWKHRLLFFSVPTRPKYTLF